MDVTLYDSRKSICCQMTRLVLAEKGVDYTKHPIDISGARNEQFEPWYLALNPKGVVPTLRAGDEVITDTLRITPFVDANFDGPALMPDDDDETRWWMARIMAPHYGVLLYKDLVDADGVCETIQERGRQLALIRERDGDPTGILGRRIDGSAKFQTVLADKDRVAEYVAGTRTLVDEMAVVLDKRPFIAGATYTIADAFATAALARFEAHGYAHWWSDHQDVGDYYGRMRARPSWEQADVVTQMGWHG